LSVQYNVRAGKREHRFSVAGGKDRVGAEVTLSSRLFHTDGLMTAV